MKRILGMVLVTAVGASMALAQTSTVTSVNAVGYNTIEIPPSGLALVCLPFESFGDSNIENLIGDQLPEQSKAYIWDRSANANAGGYITATYARGGIWDQTNIILRGDAFWLKPAGTDTNFVTLLGEVPAEYNNSATTVVGNISGVDAVGYAYPTDVDWTNTALAKSALEKDKMYFWDTAAQAYQTLTVARGGAWDGTVTIPAGTAFWFKTDDGRTVSWEEIVPYDL